MSKLYLSIGMRRTKGYVLTCILPEEVMVYNGNGRGCLTPLSTIYLFSQLY